MKSKPFLLICVFFLSLLFFGSAAFLNIRIYQTLKLLGDSSKNLTGSVLSIQEKIFTMGADINSARDMLGLPVHNYDGNNDDTSENEDSNVSNDTADKNPYLNGLELIIEKNRETIKKSQIPSGTIPLIASFDSLSIDTELLSYLEKNNLFIKKIDPITGQSRFDILRNDGSCVCPVILDYNSGMFFAGDRECQNVNQLKEILLALDSYFELRTESAIMAENSLVEIDAALGNPEFNSFLSENGYSIVSEPVENMECLDFQICDKEGEKAGFISLNRNTGEVYFLDKDRVLITSLKTIKQNEVKKN